MTPRARVASAAVVGASVVAAVLVLRGVPASAGAPLSNDATPLTECQATIRDAAVGLRIAADRGLSACAMRGIECVAGAADGAAEGCCARAGDRCGDDLADVTKAVARFERAVSRDRCAAVPFADVVSATGLAYGSLASACAALTPPGSTADATALADCLARLIVGGTTCDVARELPRTDDAFACADVTQSVADLGGVAVASCGTSAPGLVARVALARR